MFSFKRACLVTLALVLVTETAFAETFKAKTSWYGAQFQGKRMANGEPFDRHDPEIVAHKTLPLGTVLLVRNPDTGIGIVTKVQDRGPYVRGRMLDVSSAAAEILGFKDQGTATLVVTILFKPTKNVRVADGLDA